MSYSQKPKQSIDRINPTEKDIEVYFLTQIIYGDRRAKASGASFLKSMEALWPLSLTAALMNFQRHIRLH